MGKQQVVQIEGGGSHYRPLHEKSMNFVQSKPRKAGRLGVTNTLGQLQTTPGYFIN